MIGPCGVRYEQFMGKVFVSAQNGDPSQGLNVAVQNQTGELRVLGYTQRHEGRSLETAVRAVLKSYGWYDEYIESLLAGA